MVWNKTFYGAPKQEAIPLEQATEHRPEWRNISAHTHTALMNSTRTSAAKWLLDDSAPYTIIQKRKNKFIQQFGAKSANGEVNHLNRLGLVNLVDNKRRNSQSTVIGPDIALRSGCC